MFATHNYNMLDVLKKDLFLIKHISFANIILIIKEIDLREIMEILEI